MLFRFGILATAILAACGPASAQVKVRIGDLAQSLNEIASRVMIDQGIDRKYGIAAEYRAYPTLDGLFTAIRGKDVDIGFAGWTAIAQFRSKGFPVTMIFPVGRGVTVDVIVPTASPIKSIADLKGKKVGTFAGAAGTATVLFRVIASKFHGFDPGKTGDLQFAGPGLLPALLDKGEIEAAVMFDPIAAKLVGSGKYRSIGNLADAYKAGTGDDFLWIGYSTNDDFMRSRAGSADKFHAGLARSGRLREVPSRGLRSVRQEIRARTRRHQSPARARARRLHDDLERGQHRVPPALRRDGQRGHGRRLSRHGSGRGLLDPFRSP